MGKKLDTIEGIGPTFQEKLSSAGIGSVEALLETAGSAAGRQRLATETGIAGKKILTWVNHADLFRINGIAGQRAELLEAAGVDSVPALARRNPANLAAKCLEVNAEKKLVRAVPTEKELTGWISQAKELPKAVTH